MRLYDQINELEIQRDNYLEETRNKQSPAEERERLLKQVKEDNQEIASLERQSVISHDLNFIILEKIFKLWSTLHCYEMILQDQWV